MAIATSPFARLPPELRENIYRLTFRPSITINLPFDSWLRKYGYSIEPVVTAVCRLFRAEARPLFWRHTIFGLDVKNDRTESTITAEGSRFDGVFWNTTNLDRWFDHLDPAVVPIISNIVICVWNCGIYRYGSTQQYMDWLVQEANFRALVDRMRRKGLRPEALTVDAVFNFPCGGDPVEAYCAYLGTVVTCGTGELRAAVQNAFRERLAKSHDGEDESSQGTS